MENLKVTVELPIDEEGYSLLQCQYCGEFFKVTPSDAEDDGILNIYCPCCGLSSETYVTEDVLSLGEVKIKNKVELAIYEEFKKLERKTKNSLISFSAGKTPKPEYEEPLYSKLDATEIVRFDCCNRIAKIKPLLKITGCYCPFCGVKEYELK